MCALFGWLDYKHIMPRKTLKKLTQALANSAEERGSDASGIAYLKDGKVTIYKRPLPAHKVRFNTPDGTSAIMGHTRMTTQGDQKFNFNNHPFYGNADREFSLAHNGVLYNDKELRQSKNLPKTFIETDSYIAVQLIEQQKKLDFDSLKSMAEDVQGNFTFTVLDSENSLYIIKGSNPICLLHFKMLGIYVYASTESIMSRALKKVSMQDIPFSKVEAAHGDILKINANGSISQSRFTDIDYGFSWHNNFHNPDDYYTYHEEMLLEMCGCFGVSEDDILFLLDCGYTTDEIEEMLMDSGLIREVVTELKYAY